MIDNYLTFVRRQIKTIFSLSALILVSPVFAQENYSVTPIPHQVYSGSVPVSGTLDDTMSNPIVLPFYFDFFGEEYNSFYVSTNGYLHFTTENISGTTSPWSFNTTIPNPGFPVKNAVMVYHDLNNSNAQGTLTYGVSGTAPYRKMVVIFDNHSHFGDQTSLKKSTFQFVLYETLNIIDIQVVKKDLFANWNSGNAVIGVINSDGNVAIAPPGRNTGQWTAYEEGWRFSRAIDAAIYSYIKCDATTLYDLTVAQNDLLAENPGSVTFHLTQADAESQTNALPLSYTAVSYPQTIYANVNNVVHEVRLSTVNCSTDYDADGVPTLDEEVNTDTNLANDDTDSDGIPDFIDNDDDGDLVLTTVEYVFTNKNQENTLLDTDSDGIPNYRDNDDDGDGILTVDEDFNGNNNPLDDDSNGNGIADFMDNPALGQQTHAPAAFSIYPNPVSNALFIRSTANEIITEASIHSVTGQLLRQVKSANVESVDVSELQSGLYFVTVSANGKSSTHRFIKK
ncbi:MAG TPA: T9SS type A sorting domain-containing protein [Flavobacterium sp.]|jgi:hypothetical protein